MRINFYVQDVIACGHIRAEIVAREINRQCPNDEVDVKLGIFASDFYRANIMVFQRQSDTGVLDLMDYAKTKGIITVYELDDDLLAIPEALGKTYEHYGRADVKAGVKRGLASADAVICSTPPLAAVVRETIGTSKPIEVVENSIDFEQWGHIRAGRAGDVVTIGWLASQSHKMDAPLVRLALPKVLRECPNAVVHLVGWVDLTDFPELKEFKGRVKVDPWLEINTLPGVMSRWDIGLAPVIDCPFNRSKSAVKFLQYAAVGAIAVMSPLPEYKRTVPAGCGIFAKDEGEWAHHLIDLVRRPEIRRNVAGNAYDFVKNNFDVRVRYMDWMRVFSGLMQRARRF